MEKLRHQCLYLRQAYEVALQFMNKKTWKECCMRAIEELASVGVTAIINDKALRRWHIMFRNEELLHVPNSIKQREPKLFVMFPESQEYITKHCNEKVKQGSLSAESLTVEIRTKIIPKCYEKLLDEAGDDKDLMPSYNEILSMCDLSTVSVKTVWRWLVYLGYKYCENKRCYYSDGHERKDVVKDRNERFLVEYFKLERCTYRWVQLTNEDAMKLEQSIENFPKDCYYYDLSTNKREYHVDTHSALEEFIPEEYKKFGGGLSVRLKENERPVIIIGQDESTYHQYTFAKKQWKGPQGQVLLLPKSSGDIYMVSGYQSREFGLGLNDLLTNQILLDTNQKREKRKYISEDDANYYTKTPLTCDPCLRFFHAGQNNEGYWTSSHAKLQLEDVMDILSIVFPNTDFVFKFDQSSGHTKMRKDGLTTSKMNVSYGGKASNMNETTIQEVGPFKGLLTIGQKQSMVFTKDDHGPFWMNEDQRLSSK